jgi:hypothetical protein
MKASDVKIGQKVKWDQKEVIISNYDNYYGTCLERSTTIEYRGEVKEIVSKTCIIIQDSGGDEYSVEARKLKLV